MEVSIIAIGDELLIGQVTDTNSGWIARHLNPLGWSVKSVRVIGDDSEEIFRAIDAAFAQTDIVLTTGGLGPTKDDITKPTLCRYFGGELIHSPEVERNVLEVLEKRHLKINTLTAAQAMVPSSCRVIQNRVGTAPIMWFEKNGKVLVSMPGVPFETEQMMEREVIPQLLKRFASDEHIEHRTFVVIDYMESRLAMTLDEFERQIPDYIHLAYLPKPGVIRLRLTGKHRDAATLCAEMDRLSAMLKEILGSSIVACEDKTLAAIAGDMLRERGLTLATAESCTGGNVAHAITAIAGSSNYFSGSVVAYSNAVKHEVLAVKKEVLAEHGAVSEPTVKAMCEGVSYLMNTDCAIATSGIAGPGGGTPEKPVGTVWTAVKCGERVECECYHLPGTRDRVIDRATNNVLCHLIKMLRQCDLK
ncbi:MAG: CinA family nicotinamide mononucleotide deamidase-related protein [Muribaculaceae bacterium]